MKKQLRRLLAGQTLTAARPELTVFHTFAARADMPETTRLEKTVEAWSLDRVSITTRRTNAKAEAANFTIKNIKRPVSAHA